MIRIVALIVREAERLRDQPALLYHRYMRACVHMGSFTHEDACRKMGDLVLHLGSGTCMAYVALGGDEFCGFAWAYPQRWRDEDRMYVNVRERDSRARGMAETRDWH